MQWADDIECRWDDRSTIISIGLLESEEPDFAPKHAAVLSGEALERYLHLKTDKARHSFCLGNQAAQIAFSRYGVAQAEIEYGVFGFPVIKNGGGIGVSIAHTDAAAAAICFEEKTPAGIDLERISMQQLAIIRSVLTPAELQLADDSPMRLHLLWSMKEALGKTLRTGFLLPLPLLEVKKLEMQGAGYGCEFRHFSMFKGWGLQNGKYTLAIVVPAKMTLSIPHSIITESFIFET